MTEQEAIAKIHSVYPTGKKNGLLNMRALMDRLGNPQERLSMIHVAGTNGKGSCCAMIERCLREAGYKTGMYTSPYIEVYNERIRINGAPVSGDALAALVERVWPAVQALMDEGIAVTEFELGTALAFCAFAQEKVDFAIIEVGLGGRLDPTNIITPKVCVITEVGMDHMEYLGSTIGEIALEKAGIMKRRVPVALGPQRHEALDVLMAAAKGKDCTVYDPDAQNVAETADGVTFDVRLHEQTIKSLRVALRGRHQAENACAALGALSALRAQGAQIPLEAVRRGMEAVRWPGRLERFGHVLLDGAHNDPGVRALCAYCDAWLPKERTVLVTGMLEDKETQKMCERLAPRVRCVVCTAPPNPRAMAAGKLAGVFASLGLRAYAQDRPADALAQARSLAGPDGQVLVCGSLYLIGEMRTLLRGEKEFSDVI
ncbi:MAG: bifunctional folylpolyglutamate synthase/dihydrofolate synthase [Clostridia bacterium]|nr:bifunctional folylpolyglutamate synthase/dihydrofolate synthase [Clostridia bacterium]